MRSDTIVAVMVCDSGIGGWVKRGLGDFILVMMIEREGWRRETLLRWIDSEDEGDGGCP